MAGEYFRELHAILISDDEGVRNFNSFSSHNFVLLISKSSMISSHRLIFG